MVLGIKDPEAGCSAASSSTVTNCVIVGNAAYYRGGGTYGCSVPRKYLRKNSAPFGGGAYGGYVDRLPHCRNSAIEGGGANSADLHFCEVRGNTASGGGVSIGQYGGVHFCTITGNWADGGGVSNGSVDNSIVYFNKGCGDDRDQTGASCGTTHAAAAEVGDVIEGRGQHIH